MTELEMTGLLLELANEGITGIKVHYAGSGDSGSIEEIAYTKEKLNNDDEVGAFADIANLHLYGAELNSLELLSTSLYSRLQDFLYRNVLNDIEDWYNNDGGDGYVYIMIPSGKYKIENTVYYTSSETYVHEGGLIDNSLY
jgi:hypothetical protein